MSNSKIALVGSSCSAKATGKGVIKVARHYHHESVQVGGTDEDIRGNVRKGLDVTKAANYRPGWSVLSPSASAAGAPRKGRQETII
jgi:hypothetical protein